MDIMDEKTVYTTEDGHKFTNKVDAERHELLYALQQKYEEARAEWGSALAKTMKTADGYGFEFDTLYYRPYLDRGRYGVEQIGLHSWSLQYDVGQWQSTGRLSLIEARDNAAGNRWHNIGELYYKKDNAKIALLSMLRAYSAGVSEDIVTLEADLAPYLDDGDHHEIE